MKGFTRSALVLAILAFGVAGGIALTAVLSGSPADDPCRGAGTLERKIVGPPEEGSKEYTVCTKVGQRVIFDPEGTPVDVTVREEELIEYYKTHPAENPRLIADQTADAEFVNTAFVTPVVPPSAMQDDPSVCHESGARRTYKVGVSICLPRDWMIVTDSGDALEIQSDYAIVGYYAVTITNTVGTRCLQPSQVVTAAGPGDLCALREAAIGGQGHGFTLVSGREGGLSFLRAVTDEERALAFRVLFSVQEMP